MKLIRSPLEMNKIISQAKRKNNIIGFVPTMGALHAGHLSLVKQAVKESDLTIVSIYVNPKQFGAGEDLKQYPRFVKKDIKLCRSLGVNFLFLPNDKAMYPQGYSTFVDVEGLSRKLCGAFRPGHFKGVSSIVAKLLNIVTPDILYLGQKDAQQAIIIKRLVQDLNFRVKVKVMPIVRAKDGLALSSRNVYLSKKERNDSLVLYKALLLAKSMFDNGQRNSTRIVARMKQLVSNKKPLKIDYISIVDPVSLENVKKINQDCLVAIAVKIGKIRLIDNIRLNNAN